MHVVSAEEFRDNDTGYLAWVAAHRDGYVINIGRSGRGYVRLHCSTCGTITSRPPFTGQYIKICSTTLTDLDRWALDRGGAVPERCGTCRPAEAAALSLPAEAPGPAASARADQVTQPGSPAAGQEWEIDGPGDDRRQVWLWGTRYIPYEGLTPGQHTARDALRFRVRSLPAATGEILHASYVGFKPANMDAENLLLYNIDATVGGCFQPGTRHGVRFEMAAGPRRDPPSGRRFPCSYQYRLISPDSDLSHWKPVRQLAASPERTSGASRRTSGWNRCGSPSTTPRRRPPLSQPPPQRRSPFSSPSAIRAQDRWEPTRSGSKHSSTAP